MSFARETHPGAHSFCGQMSLETSFGTLTNSLINAELPKIP